MFGINCFLELRARSRVAGLALALCVVSACAGNNMQPSGSATAPEHVQSTTLALSDDDSLPRTTDIALSTTELTQSRLTENGSTWNGSTWNGSTWNGSTWNGSTWNGSTWNGSTWNGSTWNGSTWNGSTWNGSTWNGVTFNTVPYLPSLPIVDGELTHLGLVSGGATLPAPGALAFVACDPVIRKLMQYMYSCALPAGKSATLSFETGYFTCADGDAQPLEFTGSIGLAPQWQATGPGFEGGSCDEDCQRWVSACLLARTNAYGKHVHISLRGPKQGQGGACPDHLSPSTSNRPH